MEQISRKEQQNLLFTSSTSPPKKMGSLTSANKLLTEQASKLRLSATLEINELVQERLNSGKRVVHLGFGEATFPIQKEVLEAHCQASQDTSYLPVAGLMALREVGTYSPETD